MRTEPSHRTHVGELRPSQVITTFGVGSIVDLPHLAVMVMGLEDWPTTHCREVGEERLLVSVQEALGSQVRRLMGLPLPEENGTAALNPFEAAAVVGVPVATFPRWMVCPRCQLLAPLASELFELKSNPYRPEQARYVHAHCTTQGAPPTVVPARFVVACEHGHLDDFPWVEFVHQNQGICDSKGPLRLYELGVSGEAADVEVRCEKCNQSRRLADAFGKENEDNLPPCKGRRPHLRDHDPTGCAIPHVRAMLQGASNGWFPVTLSVLSIPAASGRLEQLVEQDWVVLEKVQSVQNVELLRQVGQLRDFAEYADSEVWETIEQKRMGGSDSDEPTDLKTPEWQVFTNPDATPPSRDFKLRAVEAPEGYRELLNKVVLAERLREVRALTGFTRIDSPGDYETPFEVPVEQMAPLSRTSPLWVPATEIRGEGIFFEFSESAVATWTKKVTAHNELFYEAHRRWRIVRKLQPPDAGYPSVRFVLLHSFAHALIRQLAVECGYTAASLRERIYSREAGDKAPMAGVLIYTAAPDSEGTLGGLVSLGEPSTLGRHLDQALEAMRLCSSDPLCAEHHPYRDGTTLHAAACHACLFLPETSCERGNKYLDRSVLVPTVEKSGLAIFE